MSLSPSLPVRPSVPPTAAWLLGASLVLGLLGGCRQNESATQAEAEIPLVQHALIPLPDSMTASAGSLDLGQIKAIRTDAAVSPAFLQRMATRLSPEISVQEGAGEEGAITFRLDPTLQPEAYRMEVLPTGVLIHASGEPGFFYAVQTLWQLWDGARRADGRIACGTITDQPRFAYRGMMLDIARHYHGPDEIRRLIDLMSSYKMNVLHLHLTDDQGWRIEIKAYPRLTAYGGSTQVGGGGGGFLTQADYQALVAYAAERYVTIVPEFDTPGHTNAALASYPELTCDGKAPALYEGTEVGFSTLCIGKPEVKQFMQTVIDELAAITPGPYLHIGGDESHSTAPADFRAFIEMVEPMVRAANKRMVGWDEIATVDVNESAIVQLWHNPENATAAVAKGHQVIMSPAEFAYLDMQYDSTSRIGLHWASYIEVDRAYGWDPATVVGAVPEASILGIEGPLWTETVAGRADIDYLVFPRLLGLAEVGWRNQSKRDWADYRKRLAAHAVVLEDAGVGFYRSPLVDWPQEITEGQALQQQ